MQPESKIRHRLKLLRMRHLEKAIRKATSRNPENCLYNSVTDLGSPIPLRYCSNPAPGFCGAVCDPSYNGREVAANCTQFEPAVSADFVKEEFYRFLQEASGEDLARKYPDIMALLWVLGEQMTRNFDIETLLDTSGEELRLSIPTPEFVYLESSSESVFPNIPPLMLMYHIEEVG